MFFALNRKFWRVSGGESVNDIKRLSCEWQSIYLEFHKFTTKFAVLECYYEFLLHRKEVMALFRSGQGLQIRGDQIVWSLATGDKEKAEQYRQLVQRWTHVRSVYFQRDDLKNKLKLSLPFLQNNTEAHSVVEIQRSKIDELQRFVGSDEDWGTFSMSVFNSMWEIAGNVDSRWMTVSANLLCEVSASVSLLTWLRTIRDDNAFSSSLEIALGLPEMECPIDLWNPSTKRANDEILSSLEAVRSYLHPFLYSADVVFDSCDSFLAVFSALNSAVDPEFICARIQVTIFFTSGRSFV